MFLEITENKKKQIVGMMTIESIWQDDNGDVRIETRVDTIHPDQSYEEIADMLVNDGALAKVR